MASPGLMVIILVLFAPVCRKAQAFSTTFKDRYLAGYTFDRSHPKDWLTCSLKCQHLQNCVSYNFHLVSGSCELNDHGLLKEYKPEEQLIEAKEYVFHQLRPVFKNIPPPKIKVQNQCDCNCPLQSACTPIQDTKTTALPLSCNHLWQKKRPASGAYYIQSDNEARKIQLFCQMNETQGCGSGGWTLVMKINGSKSTFTYDSSIWTNKTTFQIENGYNLAEKETKLSSYWSIPMTKLCLGMTYKGKTNWIVISYTANSLYDVIKDGANRRANVDATTWKSLIGSSSIQTGCTHEGFNANTEYAAAARARIGIVGGPSCGPPRSRIGFGTAGAYLGMKNGNSCGNEDRSVSSIMTFGYILVQ